MNEKSKILIFIDWYLPAYKAGGPVRSIVNLVELLKDKFDFYIFTSNRDLGDEKPFENIKTNTWIEKEDAQVFYASEINKGLVLNVLEEIKPQSIYFNSLFSKNFTLKPLRWIKKQENHPKIILVPRGMLGKGALQQKKLKKNLFLALARLNGFYKNIFWHATDETEKDEISLTFHTEQHKINVIPNIPVSFQKNNLKIEKEKNSLKLVFYSRISPKKNIFFLTELLVKHFSEKNITLEIWGTKEDESYFNRVSGLLKRIKGKLLKINYCGETNINELSKTIAKNHFFVLPTLHENYGHVITEAMACGLPLIISDRTPWRNLEKENIGWDISLDNESKWVEIISLCLKMDNETYQMMRNNVEKYYFEQVLSRNESLRKEYCKMFNIEMSSL